MLVRIKFGASTTEYTVDAGTTVGQLRRDSNIKATSGFRDNVRVLFHGQEMPDNAEVPEGATLVVEDRCNEKAFATMVAVLRTAFAV